MRLVDNKSKILTIIFYYIIYIIRGVNYVSDFFFASKVVFVARRGILDFNWGSIYDMNGRVHAGWYCPAHSYHWRAALGTASIPAYQLDGILLSFKSSNHRTDEKETRVWKKSAIWRTDRPMDSVSESARQQVKASFKEDLSNQRTTRHRMS